MIDNEVASRIREIMACTGEYKAGRRVLVSFRNRRRQWEKFEVLGISATPEEITLHIFGDDPELRDAPQ